MVAAGVHAHGEVGDVLPAEPGLTVSARLALRAFDAGRTLPSARMEGVLLRGDPGLDPRESTVEHAGVAAAWRLTSAWGIHAAAGAHDQDAAHVEALWLQWRRDGDGGQAWLATAGRQRAYTGAALAEAAQPARYGLRPLAHRAAFDDGMSDDGLQLGWRGAAGEADLALDAGVWRGQRFPGSRHRGSSSAGTSLHAGVAWPDWAADLAWFGMNPRGRGASTSPAAGHSHGSPACDERLTQVICFSGRSQLLGASLQWQGQQSALRLPLALTLAGWLRQESGLLESVNGLADYRGRTQGGWMDAGWQWSANVSMGLRLERLDVRQRLHGSGAALLAAEARLHQARPLRRETLRLTWRALNGMDLGLECGREVAAGSSVPFAVIRVLFATDAARATAR